MARFSGKTALVTGAARGMGRSHAVRLAEEGADVIALDICAPVEGVVYPHATKEDLAETVRQVKKLGRRAETVIVDTRDLGTMSTVVDRAVTRLSGLDIVVANAGIMMVGAWDEVSPQQWQTVIDVNLTGTWNTCAATLPHLLARGRGSITLIGSIAGIQGVPFAAPYVAAKHGVTGLAKTLSNELSDDGIRVNAVHPGVVRTTMLDSRLTKVVEDHMAENPHTRAAYTPSQAVQALEPVDVTNAVLYLASDEVRHVTGIDLSVDAGLNAL